ncbi:hypothetical protein [Variovorax paradoxus]|uniref:hypothetical protein n=1 Tax=Variovorax paradoxus TaxID=34073 RepID=UPI002865F3E2|nr:hypothetical protein [Variovorax paradoxus]MDR6455497.1 hypothetical protein [Variovorax paradoxus]
MAGEASRKFDSTPTRYSDVGSAADAPSVNTAAYKATAAQYTNDGRGLAAIGDALGSFFNAGQRALETVDAVNHQQDLIQIERENQALAKQAVTDEKLGRPMDPQYADRHAYAGTYQVSAADAHAFELAEGLRAHMAKQPLDGSVDLNQVARDYFKEQVGSGTGNPDYDARMLSQFSKSADQQIAQYQEASRATVLQNTTAEVIEQFTQRVLSPEGITTPQFAEMRERIGNIVHGDTVMRDKVLMSAIAGAVQNDGQGQSVLRSMQELGLDKTEPEYFNRISGEVLRRTNAVKTYDAGEALQRFHQDMAMEKGRYPHGILPPDRVAEYARRAYTIDSIHGVGLDKFGLVGEWQRGLQKEAGVNLFLAAKRGDYGTQDSMRVASSFGKAPGAVLSEHYDVGMSQDASALYPALAATRDGTGLVRPMANDEALQSFALYSLDKGTRAASQDTMSDTYKAEIGNPLMGRDPALMERGFNFYNTLLKGGMTKDQLHRYFPNEQAENTFWAMQIMSNGDRGIKQIAKDLVDRPYDAKDIADVARTGHIDLAAVARKGGVTGRPEEISKKIEEARTSALLDSVDRKKWFGNATVAMDSNESATFDALLLDQFQLHKRTRGAINLDDAIKAVAGQTGKYVVVPGFDGALQAVRDPFGGQGRQMLHPLNEDPSHPLAVSKGYAPIYAPGTKVTNALGDQEDLVVTWAEDASAAHKLFPGKVAEGSKLYLERPNRSGLSAVRDGSGQAIQFMPGESVALRTGPSSLFNSKAGLTATPVPTDPKEAAEFFRKNLGPGWYAQQDGFHGPNGQGFTLYYGARLKVGEKERDTEIAKRQSLVMKYRNGTHVQPNGVTDLPGGAAIVYPKP